MLKKFIPEFFYPQTDRERFYVAVIGLMCIVILTISLIAIRCEDEVRANKIQYFSRLAFDERAKILPEYKLINASLGVYDATETARIKGIVEAFRTEYYRLEALCKQANTVEELELIKENYDIQ